MTTFPITPPATLTTLPTEVIESILSYLTQYDLTRCVLVSHVWNQTLTQYLWKSIVILEKYKLKRLLKRESWEILSQNAVFVQVLSIKHKRLYKKFLPIREDPQSDVFTTSLFTNLRSLELHFVRFAEDYKVSENILELVRQNPNLRRLKIDVMIDPNVLLRIVTDHAPQLQELEYSAPWCGDIGSLLNNLPECIRAVSLSRVNRRSRSNKQDATLVARKPRRHHALESLHIDGDLERQDGDILASFLEGCSKNLKTLSGKKMLTFLLSYQHTKIDDILSNLRIVWTHLNSCTLPQRQLTDANLSRLVSLGAGWIHIDLPAQHIGSLTINAITEHCERLETLNIMGSDTVGVSGSHLQMILSRAPRLRTLQAHCVLGTDKISHLDILSSDWATTTLEHFDFKIHVPRVIVDDDEDEVDHEALQSSRNIQRQVLRRIGQQTYLRKLDIGGVSKNSETNAWGSQTQCLEMTLEAGLDELEGLKELEWLYIHYMDIRVGIPELEWMAANLPKLRRVMGLRDSLRPPREDVLQWLRVHRSNWS